MRYYQRNPLSWMRDKLGIRPETIKWDLFPEYQNHNWDDKDPEHITPNPLYEALRALVQHKDVGVESGTGIGKSYLSAAIALWFVDVHRKIVDKNGKVIDPGGLVVTVATTETQLESVIWKEIGKFQDTFSKMNPEAEFMHLRLRMDSGSADQESWGIFGKTAQVRADEEMATGLKGIHSPHMLFILDEVPGIDPAILEAIENTCTGSHNLRLMLGNPTSKNDTLHQFCSHPDVVNLRASSLDHPNVVLGKEVVPGAVTQGAITRRIRRYGDKNHRNIITNVHGIAPETSGMAMFPEDIVDKCRQYAEREPIRTEPVTGMAEGELRVYEKVKHTHLNRYIIFGDVAGDRSTSGDYHAAIVFDRVERKPVAVLHMRGPRTEYVTYLLRLAHKYIIKYGTTGRSKTVNGQDVSEQMSNYPLLVYERNNVGGLHLDDRIMEYPNLYHKRSTDTPQEDSIRASVGWHTNKSTRPDMTDSLEEWALELRDHPDRFYDEDLFSECKTFSWKESSNGKGRWEAESGCHDDLVMAMAGALTVDQIITDRILPTSIYDTTKEKKKKRNIDAVLENQSNQSSNPFDGAKLPSY